MSLKEQLEQDAKQYAGNSKDFKFEKSGNYRIRILTPLSAMATHFFGKGVPSSVCYGRDKGCPYHSSEERASVKYFCYLLDREDGAIKLGELPWSVVKELSNWESDEDYQFSSFPMPYDIKIVVDKDAAPAEMYKATPAPQRLEISAEESQSLTERNRRMTPEAYVTKRKEKQLEKHMQDGTWQKEQDRRNKLANELESLAEARASVVVENETSGDIGF